MTLDQKKAIALASARARLAEAQPAGVAAPRAPAQQSFGMIDAVLAGGGPGNLPVSSLGKIADAGVGMGLEAGGAAGGQALGLATGPFAPAAVPVFGAIGAMGGNAINQVRQGGEFKVGQMLGAGAAGAIPGGSEVKGAVGLGKEMVKQGVGNLAATAIEKGVDEGRAPTVGEGGLAVGSGILGAGASRFVRPTVPSPLTPFETLARERIDAFRAVRPYGAKVAPFELERGSELAAKAAGGKVAIQKSMSAENQGVWQKMAREQIGLKPDAAPITSGRLTEAGTRTKGDFDEALALAYHPYEVIAKNSAQGAADVSSLRLARKAEQLQWKAFQDGKASYSDYQQAKQISDGLDAKVEAAATAAGLKPDAIQEARKKIAIIYAYQNATDKSTGYVDPAALGHMFNNDVPLTGNAQKIANFYNSFSKNAVEATKAQAAGINNLTMQMSAGMASQEGGTGKTIALLNLFAGPTIRKKMMSEQYQQALAQVRTQPGAEDITAAFARFAPMSAGRTRPEAQPDAGANPFLQQLMRGISNPALGREMNPLRR